MKIFLKKYCRNKINSHIFTIEIEIFACALNCCIVFLFFELHSSCYIKIVHVDLTDFAEIQKPH